MYGMKGVTVETGKTLVHACAKLGEGVGYPPPRSEHSTVAESG